MPEATYTLEVSREPDHDGYHFATVIARVGDDAPKYKTFVGADRDELIAKARTWVSWHRAHDGSVDVIDL